LLSTGSWFFPFFFENMRKKKKRVTQLCIIATEEKPLGKIIFSRVFLLIYEKVKFDSSAVYFFFFSLSAVDERSFGISAKKKKSFSLRSHTCLSTNGVCLQLYLFIVFSLDVKKTFFFENFRQFFFVVSFFRWPLKIFESKFTISCCWSSRLCKSKRTIPYNWRWCTFSWFLTGLLSKGPFFLSVKCVVNYLMSIDKWNK